MEKSEPSNILVIDDDVDFLDVVGFLLSRHHYKLQCVKSWAEASNIPDMERFDAVLLDRNLGGLDGLDILPRIREAIPGTPVVLVTADGRLDTIVQAVRAGAFDYIGKPLDEARLFATVAKAVEYRTLQRQLKSSKLKSIGTFEGMIGVSPAMRTAFEIIRNVGPTPVSVLISGESGTGKELVARAVHNSSDRKSGPFVALNMGGLPRELVESTLFGHEKGAFTGADRKHLGACEEAQGGTLFLDEVTEMSLELQPKLLRFLQEKTFRRVGGTSEINADVRIVSATNRDPLQLVREGKFRLDLYYRLNVVPIMLPALRDRKEDICVLANAMLKEISSRYKKRFERISPDAMRWLEEYSWPGNVRQLRHVIERVVVLSDSTQLEMKMLPTELSLGSATALAVNPVPPPVADPTPIAAAQPTLTPLATPVPSVQSIARSAGSDDEIIPFADLERRAIAHAIDRCGGSPAKAAQKLGISTATIYRKIKEYEIVSAENGNAPAN